MTFEEKLEAYRNAILTVTAWATEGRFTMTLTDAEGKEAEALAAVTTHVAELERERHEQVSMRESYCDTLRDVMRDKYDQLRKQFEQTNATITAEVARLTENRDHWHKVCVEAQESRDANAAIVAPLDAHIIAYQAELARSRDDYDKVEAENAALRKALTQVLNSAGVRQQLAPSVYDDARKVASQQKA